MNYFITATDTNAGKTYIVALLTRAFRKLGFDTLAMKPIACGDWSDSKILQSAADGRLTLEEITPAYYQAPLAPIHAAPREGKIFQWITCYSLFMIFKKNLHHFL
jgi:dethiobiotin synthetase